MSQLRAGRKADGRIVRMRYRIRDFPEYKDLADGMTFGADLWRPFPDSRIYYMEFGQDGYLNVVWASVPLLYPAEGEREDAPGD